MTQFPDAVVLLVPALGMTIWFHLYVIVFLSPLLKAQRPPCEQGEYIVNGECCPMCASGNRVQRHCTSVGSTACIPCVSETYLDHPSGLTQCFNCKNCDPGSGFSVKNPCTYIKNTVCGCKQGYYCDEPKGDDCDSCARHTTCATDSKVVSQGTETNDTKCEKCPPGTFSATNMPKSCIPGTGSHQEKERLSETDVSKADSNRRHHYISIGLCLFVLLPFALMIAFYFRPSMKKPIGQNRATQPTSILKKVEENEVLPFSGERSHEVILTQPIEETGT